MKKFATLAFSLLVLASGAQAQHKSCCARPGKSSTEVFAMLGAKKDFSGKHESPKPYHYQGAGAMIEFKTPDGGTGHAFEVKAAKPSNKYLFVIHEWWGLNDYIKKETAKFAEEMPDVNIVAVDLYDGKLATKPEEAGALMQAVKTERAEAILKGAKAFAGPKARIATVGWCFGGGWSLQAALLNGKQTVGCVMYYGMPEKDIARLKSLNSDVLGIFALEDKWISPEVVKTFQADMGKAGKKVTVENYNADHAFANPSNPKFSEAYAADAHAKVLAYLKARLG